jgi:hypothetical protein
MAIYAPPSPLRAASRASGSGRDKLCRGMCCGIERTHVRERVYVSDLERGRLLVLSWSGPVFCVRPCKSSSCAGLSATCPGQVVERTLPIRELTEWVNNAQPCGICAGPPLVHLQAVVGSPADDQGRAGASPPAGVVCEV